MGEYAQLGKTQIKIGTCEQMYYLRADQVHLITAERNSVDPQNKDTAGRIRFRFPFPDEDGMQPGAFANHNRSLFVYGLEVPEDVEHYSLQFTRNYPESSGILLSTSCPFSKEGKASGLAFTLNGFAGHVGINSQRLVDGQLKLVCACGGCGALWRMETVKDCEQLLEALKCDPPDARAKLFAEVRRRIVAGYTEPNYWTT